MNTAFDSRPGSKTSDPQCQLLITATTKNCPMPSTTKSPKRPSSSTKNPTTPTLNSSSSMMSAMLSLLYPTRMSPGSKIFWVSTTATPASWSPTDKKSLKFRISSQNENKTSLWSDSTPPKTAKTPPKSKSSSRPTRKPTSKTTCTQSSWKSATSAAINDWAQNLVRLRKRTSRWKSTHKSTNQTHSARPRDSRETSCLPSPWKKPTRTGTWRARAGAKWDGMIVSNQKTCTINREMSGKWLLMFIF